MPDGPSFPFLHTDTANGLHLSAPHVFKNGVKDQDYRIPIVQ